MGRFAFILIKNRQTKASTEPQTDNTTEKQVSSQDAKDKPKRQNSWISLMLNLDVERVFKFMIWLTFHVKSERFRRRQNKKLQLLLQYFHFLKRVTSKNNSFSHSWDMLSWNGKVGLAGYPKKDNKSIRVHISDAVGVLELFMKRIVSWIQTVFFLSCSL